MSKVWPWGYLRKHFLQTILNSVNYSSYFMSKYLFLFCPCSYPMVCYWPTILVLPAGGQWKGFKKSSEGWLIKQTVLRKEISLLNSFTPTTKTDFSSLVSTQASGSQTVGRTQRRKCCKRMTQRYHCLFSDDLQVALAVRLSSLTVVTSMTSCTWSQWVILDRSFSW